MDLMASYRDSFTYYYYYIFSDPVVLENCSNPMMAIGGRNMKAISARKESQK
jgi:hypothetical protein